MKIVKGEVDLTENLGKYTVKYKETLEASLRKPSKRSEFTLKVEEYEVIKVESSCNCTAANNKEEGVIEFSFRPKKQGHFKKLSTIICRDKNNDIKYIDLNIVGYAE